MDEIENVNTSVEYECKNSPLTIKNDFSSSGRFN